MINFLCVLFFLSTAVLVVLYYFKRQTYAEYEEQIKGLTLDIDILDKANSELLKKIEKTEIDIMEKEANELLIKQKIERIMDENEPDDIAELSDMFSDL